MSSVALLNMDALKHVLLSALLNIGLKGKEKEHTSSSQLSTRGLRLCYLLTVPGGPKLNLAPETG